MGVLTAPDLRERPAPPPTPAPTRAERPAIGRPILVVGVVALVVASLIVEPTLGLVLLAVPTVVVAAQRCTRDAVTVLTVMAFVLALVPASQVVGPLGSAGRPATLVGMACLWWWIHDRVLPNGASARGRQPVRLAALLLCAAIFASWVAANVRAIDAVEARSADRNLLLLAGLVGGLLLAADGIATRERLDDLLRRLVLFGAIVAAAGILQFATGVDLANVFRIPGLRDHVPFQGIQQRSDFRRVAATASHPIEFGVVLSLLFPLALHQVLHPGRHGVQAARVRLALIGLAIPMSISRSGSLAFAVTFLAMWLSWPWRRKVNTGLLSLAVLGVLRFAVPGLLGTIRSLFTNLFIDESVKGRTDDYGVVGRYIGEAPLFGRGFGTFLPDLYLTLDNQYLLLLVEAGFVGTTLFLALLLTGYFAARGARRGADEETRSLGQALAGGCLASLLVAGTFDLLAFGMASGLVFLLVGCAGALWRLADP